MVLHFGQPSGTVSSGLIRVSIIREVVDMPLTKRQKEILDHVESFIEKNGYAPSFEEIADAFG